ncbi:hypothetical protein [Natrialbaceae archaeon AArc-T1-2]|uniref:hypothetical protein n=1 Tax=Natrialbaceae archaeon AArc-T1-2 TaxID=3053904 RepID=UPI00255AE3D5|nr:hypothetical protein [Natrialbaceae archaeon AArc-T1-2]WIV68167.1 hypothetical protein QQ977_05420 [Natrialbaceae archaeon AArc-T1-2]
MNLDELRTVQSTERTKDSLQHLRPSFYQEVGEYIADLEAERDRLAAELDDPFSSPEIRQLTDEVETAKDVVEAVYERRMGKLVKQASLAAAGMNADDEGLTAEEQDLFEDLVARIESNKGRVLDVLEGEQPVTTESDGDPPTDQTAADRSSDTDDTPPPPPAEPPTDRRPSASAVDSDATDDITAADVMGGDVVDSPSPTAPGSDDGADDEPTTDTETSPEARSATDNAGDRSSDDVDRVTVRITCDVGSILGVDDREYTLASDDVVTLPERNAAPLVERDAAEPLE